MNVFSWLPRNLTEAERHLLQTLEHRRLSNRGQLFALIADPNRRFRRICSLYLAWLQRHAMPEANAAIGVPWLADRDVPPLSPRRLNRFLGSEPVKPVRHYLHQLQTDFSARRSDLYAIPRALFFSARNPNTIRGSTFSQLLIDRADTISPSRPYHSGVFTVLPGACYPSLPYNAPYVCLILGDPYRVKRNHFRRYWLKLARDNPECILCRPEAELAERRARLLAKRIARKASTPPRRLILLPVPTPLVRKIFVPAASFSEQNPIIPPSALAA